MHKTMFITGGSRGIGEATVLHALECGWSVAFTYSQSSEKALSITNEAKTHYPHQKCIAYNLNLLDTRAIESTCDQVVSDFGEIYALVCNAAIDKPGNIVFMSDEDWTDVINVNLTSSFRLIRYFLVAFIAAKYGRFVTLSSLASNGSSGQVAYASSKAGLIGLSKSVAKEYGDRGITSNVIIPGLIDSCFIDSEEKGVKKFFSTYGPTKRLGECSEVAKAVIFLCSEDASYINGSVLNVTGGIDWVY